MQFFQLMIRFFTLDFNNPRTFNFRSPIFDIIMNFNTCYYYTQADGILQNWCNLLQTMIHKYFTITWGGGGLFQYQHPSFFVTLDLFHDCTLIQVIIEIYCSIVLLYCVLPLSSMMFRCWQRHESQPQPNLSRKCQ